MSIPLIVDANSYQYPAQGDKANTGWGGQATSWASAVTAALTKLGLGGTLSPIANAVINIDSTSKGILIPRMTTAQRDAITSPTNSLLIFNTTLKVVQYYDLSVSAWISIGARLPDNAIFSGTLQVNGNITGLGSLTLSGALQALTGNFTDTTDATNVDTAPLKTLGGMAVKKKLFVGEDANITGKNLVGNGTALLPAYSFINDPDTGLFRFSENTLDMVTGGGSRFRIESTGQIKAVYESQVGTDYNTQLDNGYLCRAWVNFNGTLTQRTGSYTISGTTVTVSITSHGLSTGNFAQLDFASGDGVDGRYAVTVINANSYTITNPVSGSTGGNVTQDAMIRASGNVSSITDNITGDYTINFTNAMPDANYSIIGGGQVNSSFGGALITSIANLGTVSTTSCRIACVNSANAGNDPPIVTIGVFR